MRTFFKVVSILLLLHMAAAIGFIGWLYQSGRLDGDRVNRVRDIFSQTIAQEQAAAKLAAETEAKVEEQNRRLAHEQNRGDDKSTAEKLKGDAQAINVRQAELDRREKEIESLRVNAMLARQSLEKRKQEVDAAQKAFEEKLAAALKRQEEDGFKKTVALYEGLPAEQTKKLFQELLKQGRMSQVVEYLAAMKPRKATSVLEEFQTGAEVTQAAELTEKLRTRGIDLAKTTEPPG